MKRLAMIFFTTAVLLIGYGCELEEDDPESIGLDEQELPADDGEAADCAEPNMLFGNLCCSPEGTVAGRCKYDREWISEGGCDDEYWSEGVQYCCGGAYLSVAGAYGYQCSGME